MVPTTDIHPTAVVAASQPSAAVAVPHDTKAPLNDSMPATPGTELAVAAINALPTQALSDEMLATLLTPAPDLYGSMSAF